MIDLYALTSPNVQKIFLMLEETGLEYRVITVDVWKGAQFKPEFIKINPNSKVPAIVDHEGPNGKPYTVFESGAILLYLADKTGRFLPADKAARFDAIQWLMIQLTGIGPISGQAVHFKRYAPAGNEYSASRYGTEVKRLYQVLEKRLGQVRYLGGAEYGIADIATFPWTRNRAAFGIEDQDHPNLARWFAEISARSAVQRAIAKLSLITSSAASATPDDLDRMFGRGKYALA